MNTFNPVMVDPSWTEIFSLPLKTPCVDVFPSCVFIYLFILAGEDFTLPVIFCLGFSQHPTASIPESVVDSGL